MPQQNHVNESNKDRIKMWYIHTTTIIEFLDVKLFLEMHTPLELARLYQTEHILQESPLKCNYKVRRDMFHLTTLDRVLQYPGLKDSCPVNHCSPCAYKKHSFSHSFTQFLADAKTLHFDP